VAAIEVAFVVMMIFFVIYGIVTFGAVLYTQQVVSRAAEDGARALPLLLTRSDAEMKSKVQATVFDSLAMALIIPPESNTSPLTRRNWIASNAVVVTSIGAATGGTRSVEVSVSYPYSANRLMPSLPFFDTSRWMPDNLLSRATVAIPS
jgi:Flp pilus assembly protein TadG